MPGRGGALKEDYKSREETVTADGAAKGEARRHARGPRPALSWPLPKASVQTGGGSTAEGQVCMCSFPRIHKVINGVQVGMASSLPCAVGCARQRWTGLQPEAAVALAQRPGSARFGASSWAASGGCQPRGATGQLAAAVAGQAAGGAVQRAAELLGGVARGATVAQVALQVQALLVGDQRVHGVAAVAGQAVPGCGGRGTEEGSAGSAGQHQGTSNKCGHPVGRARWWTGNQQGPATAGQGAGRQHCAVCAGCGGA